MLSFVNLLNNSTCTKLVLAGEGRADLDIEQVLETH